MASLYGEIEKKLLQESIIFCGVDEVGRGALAGPVYAGAAILDFEKLFALDPSSLALVRDSKSLSRKQRAQILPILHTVTISFTCAKADVDEIESLGLSQATFLAMKRAIAQLTYPFSLLLLDGKFPIPAFPYEQKTIIGGDASCYSIAAASILAKETRDRDMFTLATTYPDYAFDKNVGYATAQHLKALRKNGFCPIHRKTFGSVKEQRQRSLFD